MAEVAHLLGRPDATEGTPGWFGERMRAMGNILGRMAQAEKDVIDNEAGRIAAAGYPREERIRWVPGVSHGCQCIDGLCRRAKRFAGRRLDDAANKHYLEMGLLSISFVTREEFTGGQTRFAVEV